MTRRGFSRKRKSLSFVGQLVAICLGLCSFFGGAGKLAGSGGADHIRVPIRVRLAICENGPVKPREWVDSHIEGANRISGSHGIVFDAQIDTFRPDNCELITRKDRHRGAIHVAPGTVTVLVVARVQDLDVPDYNLMGVHWRYRGRNREFLGRRWIYLTARATPPVLAHELCHFFGLSHDRAGGNLMTPGPSDPIWDLDGAKPKPFRPRLFPYQVQKLKRGIESFLGSVPESL